MFRLSNRNPLLVVPGAGLGWELWDASTAGETSHAPKLREIVQDISSVAALRSSLVFAIPVSQCSTLALWLPKADAALHEQMILSQLEKRAVVSRSRGKVVFDYAVIASCGNRDLLRITMLAPEFPDALCFPRAEKYCDSASLLPIPDNHLAVWQECDHLVLAATRGSEVVYTQVLARTREFSESLVQELNAIRISLELEQVIDRVEGIVLWSDIGALDSARLLKPLHLPISEDVRPAPVRERISKPSNLVPLPLQALRRSKSQREKNVRTAVMAVAIYIAIVVLLSVYLRSLQVRRAKLFASVSADKPFAAELERTAARWRAVEPAVNPMLYAIEQFYQCASVLPNTGIRFTTFETKGTDIRVRGTARNAPTVFSFVDRLRKNKALSNYQWKLGQPKLQKDDTAEFQLDGSLIYARPK